MIYLDNAATTRMDPDVLKEMLPYLKERFGNPSSMHYMGMEAKNAVEGSRKKIANHLNCQPEELIFTGSGTESDNLAILGFARQNKERGNHLITSKIEHPAVMNCFKQLEKEGFNITYIDVDTDGIIDLKQLENAITAKTILVSVIYANNEIGVIQDIPAITDICRKNKVTFHTDACQATNYLEIDVKKLGVDMMTINASKIYGPKGVGVLFRRKGTGIQPIIFGGGQESGLRAGTENVANIVGMAKALELAIKMGEKESARIGKLRDRLIDGLLELPETRLNGHPTKRLPNNVNISFLNIEGESLLLMMGEEGIYASTGSACSSSKLEPSHVITAIGMPHEISHSSIRMTLGRQTTKKDIDQVLDKMPGIVERLRKISALNMTMEHVLGDKHG
ncbi:MAG: cysteine desulfurase [Nanoarchaeota archaeon]|nr:cysteine desulfurase [Nanoarchaeota archaeon]